MPTHTAATVRPLTDAERLERRTVVLFLLSIASRPVEGEEHDVPPPAYFLRSALSVEWRAVANCLDVRRAMRRKTGARALGRTGFVAAVREISDACRAANDADRAMEHALIRDEYAERIAEVLADAEEAERAYPAAAVTALQRERDEALAEAEPLLPAHIPDNEVAVAHRTSKGADYVRLRRDADEDDAVATAWERLADIYAGPGDGPAEFRDLLHEANALGFTTTTPLPASALYRVEAWEDEEEPVAQRPAPPVSPPAPPPPPPTVASWTCAVCGTPSTWRSPRTPPLNPCACGSTLWHD